MIAIVPNTTLSESYPFQSNMTRRGFAGVSEDFIFLKNPEGFTDEQLLEINNIGGRFFRSSEDFKRNYLNYYFRSEGEKYYLIYDYIKEGNYNIKMAPFEVDFNLLGLHKKRTIVKGELVKIEYYADYDSTTKVYSKMVLEEDRLFVNNADDYVDHRILTITWIYNDGTQGSQKQTKKYYSFDESSAAGKRRRVNIINTLKLSTVYLISETDSIAVSVAEDNAKPFLRDIIIEIELYVEGDGQPLIDKINNNSTDSFLDNNIQTGGTIRQYLIAELS